MSRPRRRLGFWSAALALAWLGRLVLAPMLAARDPISEVLLGRAGSALPLVGLVLLLQIAAVVVFPVIVAAALVGALHERFAK